MPRRRGDDQPTAPGGEPERLALRIETVDVLPTDLGSFLVRVAGAWEPGAARPGAQPELVVGAGEEERRFAALAETSEAAAKAAPEADAFRATFSVPEALGPALGAGLRLAIGSGVAELPPARPPGAGVEPVAGATVIDRAVLAERRARRAEMAEEANAERAQEAEGALRDLEAELAKLEVRLERAVAERAGLEAQAAEREREARAAAQREYAERRRREEVAEEAAGRVEDAEEAVLDLRSRLRDAETRAVSLSREAEELRRRAAEAEHALETADAARGRAEGLAAELGDWFETSASAESQAAAATGEAEPEARPQPPPAGGTPGWLREPLAVMRAEAALARRAVSEVALSDRDAGRQEIERALEVVDAAERRVREAVAALRRMTAQLRAERQAHESEVRSLAADLAREREARATAAHALDAERRARASSDQALAGEREARATLERDLDAERRARASSDQALAAERDARTGAEQALAAERYERAGAEQALAGEREARATLERDLEAERRARADAEQAARDAFDVAERGSAVQARMGAVVEELRGELDTIRSSARTDEPELQEFVTTAAEALRQAEHRIAEAHRAAADLTGRIEELEGALLVERAARVEAEAAAHHARPAPAEEPAPDGEPAPAEPPGPAEEPAHAEPVLEPAPDEPVPEPAPAEDSAPVEDCAPAEEPAPAARPEPAVWLPRAIEAMLDRDRAGAVQLLLDLLPGQALNLEAPLDYRLLLADEGRWAVSLRPGRGTVGPDDEDQVPRPAFHVKTDPRGLLDVLAQGGSRQLRRRVKIGGTRRRRRALKRLPPGVLRPDALAAAGIWLDPLLLLRALAHLVEPAWTEGHDLVVAHEITGPRGRSLWVQATPGAPLEVLAAPPRTPTTVTVQTTQAAFQRFLGGEPNGPQKWTIRGDVGAVEALSGWLERARTRK
jgi:hypothetical protein